MRRVILESPFAGQTAKEQQRNLDYTLRCMAHSIGLGEAPFASHLLYPQVLNDTNPVERLQGIEMGLTWGEVADATVVYEDYGISRGMRLGVEAAMRERRQVIYRKIGQ